MANKSKWQPNDTQKLFMAVVLNYPNGVTLFELELAGYSFKSGAINPLVTKGLVKKAPEKREFSCDVVYNGVVVGKTTKSGTVYFM